MTDKGTFQALDIRAIVLVGGRDFGRCPLAARLPAALWPIGDQPALVRVLNHLADEGITRAAVCCDAELVEEVARVCRESRLAVALVREELISGTGGCLRNAASSDPGQLIMVLSGSMAAPPPVQSLIEAHQSGGADMTVVFNPGRADDGLPGSSAEIFLCGPQVLGRIPAGGYSDIKEGVIPAILRAGGGVRPYVLKEQVGNFRDREGYLEAIEMLLRKGELESLSPGVCEESQGGPVITESGAFVHPDAKVCGPVLIGHHARIEQGAVVIGPAIIGSNVVVGENSAVVRSVLWARASMGGHCEIRESILDYGATASAGAAVVGRAVPARLSGREEECGTPLPAGSMGHLGRLLRSHLDRWAGGEAGGSSTAAILGVGAVLIALFWSYWPAISELILVWRRSDEYSSGMLVPFLAAYVIWSRREEICSFSLRPALLWGAGVLLCAQAVRGLGLYWMYQSAERLSLILSIGALVLLMTGWRYLKKLWPVLIFLCLMLPWPNRVQSALALPLQRWATDSAVFCLELAGWEIVQDGNVIHIGGATVAVAEACNGLRMITAFFVISGLVVLLVKRAWWTKLILLISSLPIALLCNTLRLAVTSVFFTIIEGEVWEKRFHDWGGYAMMPLALAMVVGELWLLSRLTTPPVEIEPAIISRRQPQQVPDP